MNPAYRDILKHSAIYGLGQILSRLASFLLLPLYTRYLTPADYGRIAVLDLTAGILGLLIGAGLATAVTRYHFEAKTDSQRDCVWWTGLTFTVTAASAILAIAWILRSPLAALVLGPEEPLGPYYCSLILATVWVGSIVQLPSTSLRVDKRSATVVGISLAGLLLNIALNVCFLTLLGMGVAGILWGNLIANSASAVVLMAMFLRSRGPYSFAWPLVWQLLRFGAPLVLTGLLATLMHQADRYLLRLFSDMEQVGIYSLAMAIAQGVNSLILIPFSTIWNVVIYEIAQQPDASATYVAVYRHFVQLLALVLFGVALLSKPIIALMAAPEYGAAAELIPIACLGCLFFSLHEHFRVPALLAKKTTLLIVSYTIAVIVTLLANAILIPHLGVIGAAWAAVLAYAAFSFTGLIVNRRLRRYPYPHLRCAAIVVGMAGCFVLWRFCRGVILGDIVAILCAAAIWAAWAAMLLGALIRRPAAREAFRFVARMSQTLQTIVSVSRAKA